MKMKSMQSLNTRGFDAIMLAVVVFLAPLPAFAGTYGGGKGVEMAPYLIGHAKHLYELGMTPADWDKDFELVADLDLTGMTVEVIGNPSTRLSGFSGIFDGNGHVLSNLTQKRPDLDYVGLFGLIGDGGVVTNLVMDAVIVSGESCVGGLVGFNSDGGTVSSSHVTGSVDGVDSTGGLLGFNKGGTVTNCSAAASVDGVDSTGGLVGTHHAGTISTCYATGNVTSAYEIGGLLGRNSATVTDCFATGNVEGRDQIGGLVGYNSTTGVIFTCYAAGAVSDWGDLADPLVGGLVGFNDGSKVLDAFWDIETSGQATSDGGTGQLTVDMMKLTTFKTANWDFATPVWTIVEDVDYPKLAAFASGPPQIVVDPLTHDFGNVQMGESSTVIVTLGNEGGSALTLTDVLLGGDAAFAVESPGIPPGTLMPGQWVELVISCTPIDPGWMTGTLEIHNNDPEQPLVTVGLQGFGTLVELPSDEQVEAIVTYVDDCVEEGTIVGDGPGSSSSSDGRLNALLNQLDAVEDLIQEGSYDQACKQLEGLYKKTDGLPKPPDFVSGNSAAVLSQLILDLMASIGCE